jgi:hypothetical protein
MDSQNIKKGDWVVCICKNWQHFTYGKKYRALSEIHHNLIDVTNDIGENPIPCLYGYDGPGKKVYYFTTLEGWREIQLEKVL